MSEKKRTKEEILHDLAECEKISARAAICDDWQVVMDMADWEADLKRELEALIPHTVS